MEDCGTLFVLGAAGQLSQRARPRVHACRASARVLDSAVGILRIRTGRRSGGCGFARERLHRLRPQRSDEQVAGRVLGDPRFDVVYGGFNVLARIVPNRNRAFIVDWRVLAPGAARYPRMTSARMRGVEGFVDMNRLDRISGCMTFATGLRVTSPGKYLYEFAPYGAGTLAIDGRNLASTQSALEARLGEGLFVQVDLQAGTHEFRIETCRAQNGRGGFYLLERAKLQ